MTTTVQIATRAPLAFLFTLLVFSTVAEAAPVTFVASNGKDSNPCSRPAPCRTLQRAHNVTTAGGELQILDSGSYRAILRISKSITVSGVGSNATAGRITIENGNAVVTLRRLLLNGAGLGGHGVQISAAKAVHIEDCEIERFPGAGIRLNDDAELFVSDTVSRDNGGS
ncbi:MAG TPA: hypothetical protein VGA77_04610, partial [Propylenella sp.]